MKITALVDADVFCYTVGFGKKDESEEFAIAALDETLYSILEDVQPDYHCIYLTDTLSFRKDLAPFYKANRTQPRPAHYDALRGHLEDVWCAETVSYLEGDDLCSLNTVNTEEHGSVIVHVDKDLNMIPGSHFNPTKREFYTITNYHAMWWFYTQMLTGDRTDNIPPVRRGMGPVTAESLLAKCKTEREFYDVVRKEYDDDARMVLHANLLWLVSNDRTNLILEELDDRSTESRVLRQAAATLGADELRGGDLHGLGTADGAVDCERGRVSEGTGELFVD